jgi:hypothetical protein
MTTEGAAAGATRGVARRIAAIVCFGLPERTTDQLIDALVDTAAAPDRWVVFGMDANLLAALETQWGKHIDLVLAWVPSTHETMREAALDVLAREAVPPGAAVWIQGADIGCSAPVGFLATLVADGQGVTGLAASIENAACRRMTGLTAVAL